MAAPLVLIIDDDLEICDLLRTVVVQQGYEAAVATSGAQGLELARKLHPDLVTLDLGLPGRSGQEVLRQLRNSPRTWDIPIIVMTGYTPDVLDEWVPLPQEQFFQKPLELGRFKQAMQAAVGSPIALPTQR